MLLAGQTVAIVTYCVTESPMTEKAHLLFKEGKDKSVDFQWYKLLQVICINLQQFHHFNFIEDILSWKEINVFDGNFNSCHSQIYNLSSLND